MTSEKNVGNLKFGKFCSPKQINEFLKIDKIGLHGKKTKQNFCSEKDNVKRMRIQATDWEKMFVKDIW